MEHIIDHYSSQIPILPGEHIPAYIVRLCHMVKGTDLKVLMSFNGSSQVVGRHQLFPRVASSFAYRDGVRANSGAILKEHLSARYWRGFVCEERYKEHVNHVRYRTKSKRSMFSGEESLFLLKPMKYCTECRKRDIERFGVPIVHAKFQVPSIYYCDNHKLPLSYAGTENAISYPSLVESDNLKSEDIQSRELFLWLHNVSSQLLDTPSASNREWITDLKAALATSFRAKQSNGRLNIDRYYVHAWRRFLSVALTTLCTKKRCYFEFSEGSAYSLVNQIKQQSTVVHPLFFLLAMKFAEERTAFKNLMTNHYAPPIYVDETIYSYVARLHLYFSETNHRNSARRWFGKSPINIDQRLPIGLELLSENSGVLLKDLLHHHTYYPIFAAFSSQPQSLKTAMVSNDGRNIANVSTVAQAGLKQLSQFKYCPECISQISKNTVSHSGI